MVHEVLSPRVKNGNEAGLHAETLLREFRERLGGGLEKDVVETSLFLKARGLSSSGRVKTTWKYSMGRSSFPRASTHFSFLRNWHFGQCLFPPLRQS